MVKCKDCGHLCSHNVDTGEDLPLSQRRRRTGEATSYEIDHCEWLPLCSLSVVEFSEDQAELVEASNAERQCGEFLQFHPGLAQKDYTEMKLLQAVEERTLRWREEDLRHRKITYVIAIIAAILGCAGSVIATVVAILQ